MPKIFGHSAERGPKRQVHGPEVERALAGLALDVPNASWAALVHSDGRLAACFPSQPATGQDRIAAMSGAIQALGQRICRELGSGALHYALVAGADGLNLVIVLDKDFLLALGLSGAVSVDAVFESLRLPAIPLLQMLGIEEWPI